MIISSGVDVKIAVFDIETLVGLFDVGVYDPDTKEWFEFQVSAYKNDIYKLVHFYQSKHFDYWVSYNGIRFDHQVLQYVVNEHQKWADLSNLEICAKIAAYSTKVIEDSKFGLFPAYKEEYFSVKPLDLFLIHHFDNDAKWTSLKWCEFMMNMNVEEMPIHHSQAVLTEEEVETVISYRRNDVIATLALLYLTIGQPNKVRELNGDVPVDELKDYQDANKIEQRLNIQKETGLQCLNWSDVKIGEEMNKMKYMDAKGIKYDKDLIPKKVKHPYGQKFKNFFPKTMSFQTSHLNDFISELGEKYVLAEKQEFPIRIGNTTYTIAKGGIHSTESNRCIIVSSGMKLEDADVGAQYPNSIIKLGVYPPHLDNIILDQFKETVKLKDVYKGKGKIAKEEKDDAKVRSFKSLEGLTKLQMNGGYYGKLGQPGSFLEYPEGVLKVCMGNQIEILMLIESLEMNGFNVVSGNTDGILTYYPASRESEYKRLCSEWENKVGNNVLGKLEFAEFEGIWQESVNSYLAKKTDGTIKRKGRFVVTYGSPGCEINKNKSKRIIAMALGEYFANKVDPIDYITNHANITDFCIAKKASGQLHYEELHPDKTIIHKKLIRYYVSNNGNIFKKRGINNEGNPMDNHCEALDKDYPWMKQPVLTYFNKFEKKDNYDINYSYYILETLKRIDKIEKTNKAKMYAEKFKPHIQTSLF
jgi:hypothetical protein